MSADRIYLDYNATQPMSESTLEAMLPFFRESWANPSSRHQPGEQVRAAFEDARSRIAHHFGARPAELTFTSGATESINWALRGVMATRSEPGHLVISTVEHSVTLDVAARLEAEGHRVTRVPVERDGTITLERLELALAQGADLLSLIWVNNETGVRFDIESIGDLARRHDVPLHVDAVQIAGKEAGLFGAYPVDLMTFGGHKFGSAKGVGGLLVRRGTRIRPLIWGGHQERARRSGTENVAGVIGMAAALDESLVQWKEHGEKVGRLRDRLENRLLEEVEGLIVNGQTAPRVGNTLSVCFRGIEGVAIVITMSQEGIAVSSGSACSAFDPGPSPVLVGMDVPGDMIHGAVRFSLGTETTEEDIDRAATAAIAAWRHVSRVNSV